MKGVPIKSQDPDIIQGLCTVLSMQKVEGIENIIPRYMWSNMKSDIEELKSFT